MLGPLKAWCNENNISLREFPLPAAKVAELIYFTESGKVSFNIASTRVLPAMIAAGGGNPLAIATRMNLIQESDESTVEQWVKETLAAMPDKVKEYQAGKKALIGLFAGQVKKLSNGKAAMPLVNKILEQQLKQ
jgi:aspartyl-tRNA(Asn)/glutamyl-tRNA(Gln) amidotransferase subunit B